MLIGLTQLYESLPCMSTTFSIIFHFVARIIADGLKLTDVVCVNIQLNYLVDAEPLLDQFLHRIPSLSDIEVQQIATCAESTTPDGKYVMGGVPEV